MSELTTYDTGPLGECVACKGARVIGGQPCALCKGLGWIGDSGPDPGGQTGLCAFKPCGCARDWSGDAAQDSVREQRLEYWQAQGLTWRPMLWDHAAPLLTEGDGCQHEQRATPRAEAPVIDLTDLPPGGSDRPRLKLLAVQVHHAAEDDSGSITHVILTGDLSDGTHRECEVVIPLGWTEPL